jgi:maleylacetoacetate isomerase
MSTVSPKNLRLYHYWRSSCSWRVRWGLAEKGLLSQVELVHIHLLKGEQKSPEHLKRNPMGYVPALQFKDTNEILTESTAILEWIDEVFSENSYQGKSSLDRAHIRQLSQIINSGTQPLQNMTVQAKISETVPNDPAVKKEWTWFWTQKGLKAYEEIARTTAGRFSVGDQLSAADFCLIPQIYNAKRNEIPIDPYPTILRIYNEAVKTESYLKSEPELFNPEK